MSNKSQGIRIRKWKFLPHTRIKYSKVTTDQVRKANPENKICFQSMESIRTAKGSIKESNMEKKKLKCVDEVISYQYNSQLKDLTT